MEPDLQTFFSNFPSNNLHSSLLDRILPKCPCLHVVFYFPIQVSFNCIFLNSCSFALEHYVFSALHAGTMHALCASIVFKCSCDIIPHHIHPCAMNKCFFTINRDLCYTRESCASACCGTMLHHTSIQVPFVMLCHATYTIMLHSITY